MIATETHRDLTIESINELKNCLRIFERDRTPNIHLRNERILRLILKLEASIT